MDRLYEITLLLSLAFGAIALALVLLRRVGGPRAPGSARGMWLVAAGAWIALLVSVIVHLGWGHTPGGPQALSPLEFVGEHRAFIVAALLPALTLVARRRAPQQPRS